nr:MULTISPECIES: PAS domain-containing protein [Myxococcaceae]
MERAVGAVGSGSTETDGDVGVGEPALAGALVSAAPVALGVLSPDMRLVQLNPALARLLDVAEERALGGAPLAQLAPELAPYLQVHAQHVIATGRALGGVPLAFEHPPGSGAVREVQASYFPLLTDGGHVRGVGLSLIEVPEAHRSSGRRSSDHEAPTPSTTLH